MLGRVQMDWLKAAARLAGAVQDRGGRQPGAEPARPAESWRRLRDRAHELLDFVRDRRRGRLFLSGDRHRTELIRVDRPGLYPLYDFTSSPLTAGTAAPRDAERENPNRVAGTLLVEHSFAQLRFEGKPAARRVRLQAYDKTGA